MPYCSQECQKTLWKSHKQTCFELTGEKANIVARLNRQLERFVSVFGPLVALLTTFNLAIHSVKDPNITPRTHLLRIHLADLLSPSIKPSLRIDKIELQAKKDLPATLKEHIDKSIRFYPDPSKAMPYILVYPHPSHAATPFTQIVATSYEDDPFAAALERREKEGTAGTIRRLSLSSQIFIEGINEMAAGKRPDLLEAIKASLKR
jgi:hypothetical protein